MTFQFHPEAEKELYDAAHWYEDRSPLAGDRFVSAVRLAINAILKDPHRYQCMEGDIRIFRLRKFPFRLYYVWNDELKHMHVYAVMHEKRAPDYWRRRLEDG